MTTVIGILILVCALFLVISVVLQSSKNHRMSGVVSGGAETFFGKQKGKTIDAKLSKATAIISTIFALLVLALYLANAANQSANENVAGSEDAGTVVEQTDDTHAHVHEEQSSIPEEGTQEADAEVAEGETAETAEVAQ